MISKRVMISCQKSLGISEVQLDNPAVLYRVKIKLVR